MKRIKINKKEYLLVKVFILLEIYGEYYIQFINYKVKLLEFEDVFKINI